MFKFFSFLPYFALATALWAQATPRTVQANGSASISANPDQAQIDVGVTTNGSTAQDAAQQNATQTNLVLTAIKAVLGTAGSIQTVSYSVSPRYSSTPNQPPVIIGYSANNTVRVTTSDLSLIGKLIDSANQAGANNVGGLSFGLRDPEPVVEQALTQATKQAVAHANAIAAGLGAKTGPLVSAQENSSFSPVLVGATGAAGASTPIQTGTVTVFASVTIHVQLLQ